jgi:two-component system cell cycle response regulator DivK
LLLVDDNTQNLRLAGLLLKSAGICVQTAGSAEEALVLLERERFALILVDIQLPGMDGMELTRRIRNTPAWAGLVVVAVTACAMRGDRETILAAGFDGYIGKPIDTRNFANQVTAYLARAPGPEASANAEASGDSENATGPEIVLLKNQFLISALREARALLSLPDSDLGDQPTFTTLHRWEGVGGSIGLTAVTDLASQAGSHSGQSPAVRGSLIRPLIAAILAALESSQTPGNSTVIGQG